MTIEQALIELREAERKQSAEDALKIIAGLSDEERRKLLDLPAVQKLVSDAEVKAAQTMLPGSTVCDDRGRVVSKVPWTWGAMVDEFGTVDWTPMQNRMICINGIDLWVESGRPVRTPPQFRDVAMEAWNAEQRQLETSKEIVRRNFGDNGMVLFGDGTRA